MIKTLNSKIALLGFTSLCLMSAAYANSDCDTCDDGVVFEVQPDSFSNIVAGGSTTTVSYTIQNMSTSPASVYDISVVALPDDDFQDDDDLIKPVYLGGMGDCTVAPFTLAAAGDTGDTCIINLQIDPSTIENADDSITTGLVDRDLVVSLNTSQRELDAEIEFKVTIAGSTDSFSLIGDYICNEYTAEPSQENCVLPGEVSAKDGMLQVDQDVAGNACLSEEADCVTDQITLNGSTVYYNEQTPTINAENDLSDAIANIGSLTCDTVVDTDFFETPQVVFPNHVYCFDYTDSASPVVISKTITYASPGTYIFQILAGDGATNALNINAGASFEFMDSDVCAENIYWFVDGDTQLDVNTLFVGNLLTTGDITASADEGAQGLIYGRLLSQGDLLLQGNAIIDPATLGGDCDCNCGE